MRVYEQSTSLKEFSAYADVWKSISVEEKEKILERIRSAEKPDRRDLQSIIQAHFPLIVRETKKWEKFYSANFDDLLQLALSIVIDTAPKYKPERGAYTTYVCHSIRWGFMRHAENIGRMIRLPAHIIQSPKNENPSDAFIAQPDDLRFLVHISLNQREKDFYENDNLEARLTRDTVHKALEFLPTKLRTIIILRYGLSEFGEHTLEQVGDMFSLSRERVRQLEKEALQKLKVGGAFKLLKGLL